MAFCLTDILAAQDEADTPKGDPCHPIIDQGIVRFASPYKINR